MKRIESIDFTRGLVMIIMALDHVREFIHNGAYSPDPVNLQTTTAFLYLTRWITHICAPSFLFLAGTSAYFSFRKHNNPAVSRKFLLTRGIILIIIDILLINFALWFDIRFRLIIIEVIAAIGFSFIFLSFFIHLPVYITGTVGILIIFCHNLLPSAIDSGPVSGFLYSLFFRPGMTSISPDFSLYVAYPIVPWLGIMLTGFASGKLFEQKPEVHGRKFLLIGLAILSFFIIIRLFNSYGDPAGWTHQKTGLFTLLSFLNTTKYPPSLLFILLFIGLMFMVISVSYRLNSRIKEIVSVFGKVPFFFFVIHLYLIHLGMFIMLFLQGFSAGDFRFGLFLNGRPEGISGVPLGVVYLIWAGVLVFLFPLCKWYGRYKTAHSNNIILRYF